MSSTGDELSDAESQPHSSPDEEPPGRSVPPPSAQAAREIPSSPPAQAGASQSRAPESQSQDGDLASDDSDRENRFEGPASTWRSHTQDERQLVASLDQQRANDLSVHLYNAHALKARLYDREATSTPTPWRSKRRWIKPAEDGNVPWQPDRNWTAWPLPADEVPRREEVFGVPPAAHADGDGTYRKSETWLPSADLQEEIAALVLRKAKERFRQRTWATATDNVEGDVKLKEPPEDPDAEAGAERSSSEDDVGLGDLDEDAGDRKPVMTSEQEYSQPVFLADDERANAILTPSVRHILTKFDDLLIGLHRSKRGHRRTASTSRSRSTAQSERSIPPASSSGNVYPASDGRFHDLPTSQPQEAHSYAAAAPKSRDLRPVSRARRASAPRSPPRSAAIAKSSRSRGRSKGKRKATVSDDEGSNFSPDDESAAYSEVAASPARSQRKRRPSGANSHELGLRDWSEVLGIASLVGWDQAVVDRAARRCASLFGEGMTFRTMPETSADHVDDHTVQFVPDMVPVESETESEGDVLEPAQATAWFCPYQDCARHQNAYEKGWRWREHLQRTHKLSKEQVEEVELGQERVGGSPRNAALSEVEAEQEAGSQDEVALEARECQEMMADKDFTPRELEIMGKAWNCMTEEPKVDYDKLAELCSMGNPRSAGNAWRLIKAKIMAKGGITKADGGEENSEGATKATPKATPKASPKKRGKAKADKDDDESPAKKAKGRKGKATKKDASADADDQEDGASPVKAEPEEESELS
ncbi:hypothetical protein LTR36_002897 [Oleoguttula mirabilis]|uniref:Rrn9 domain-containing protein n=1 Tax=Oleoguttula mirabilis TaxID=1507867 RepID=A0AAV9JK42_9PEZI|nr:hypothetical protein LTR36_002897 [Oleoguttula mirabilis]